MAYTLKICNFNNDDMEFAPIKDSLYRSYLNFWYVNSAKNYIVDEVYENVQSRFSSIWFGSLPPFSSSTAWAARFASALAGVISTTSLTGLEIFFSVLASSNLVVAGFGEANPNWNPPLVPFAVSDDPDAIAVFVGFCVPNDKPPLLLPNAGAGKDAPAPAPAALKVKPPLLPDAPAPAALKVKGLLVALVEVSPTDLFSSSCLSS